MPSNKRRIADPEEWNFNKRKKLRNFVWLKDI
jgi:hypothetical protein